MEGCNFIRVDSICCMSGPTGCTSPSSAVGPVVAAASHISTSSTMAVFSVTLGCIFSNV